MKTFIFFLSMLICFAGIPAHAQGALTGDKTPVIYDKIQKNIHVPESMKASVSSERVRVLFSIGADGHAQVIDVSTRCPELKKSVIRQFEAIDFSEAGDNSGATYSIWLNFNVL